MESFRRLEPNTMDAQINRQATFGPRVDPWVFLVIPRTYFRANIPNVEGGFVLAYNLTMLAIVGVCLAVIQLRLTRATRAVAYARIGSNT